MKDLSKVDSNKELWHKINRLKKYKCTKNINNSWDETQKEEYLKHISKPSTNDTPIQSTPSNNIRDNNVNTPNFSLEDFLEVLAHKRVRSAQGPDRVSYKMMKALKVEEKEKLFQSIMEVWKKVEIPETWRCIRNCPYTVKRDELR